MGVSRISKGISGVNGIIVEIHFNALTDVCEGVVC